MVASHIAVIFQDIKHCSKTWEKNALIILTFYFQQKFVQKNHLWRVCNQMLTKFFSVFWFNIFKHVWMVTNFTKLHHYTMVNLFAWLAYNWLSFEEILVNFYLKRRQLNANVHLYFIRKLCSEFFFCPSKHKRSHYLVKGLNNFYFLILIIVFDRSVCVWVHIKPLTKIIFTWEYLWH